MGGELEKLYLKFKRVSGGVSVVRCAVKGEMCILGGPGPIKRPD